MAMAVKNGETGQPHWAESTFIGGSCAFLFPYFHANEAKHELCWLSITPGSFLTFVTNFCSWVIVITLVVKINVFFCFVLLLPLLFCSTYSRVSMGLCG